jgi:hypothetical protein
MENDFAEIIAKIRQSAFDARCNAAKTEALKTKSFWLELARKCDQAADGYEQLYRQRLN